MHNTRHFKTTSRPSPLLRSCNGRSVACLTTIGVLVCMLVRQPTHSVHHFLRSWSRSTEGPGGMTCEVMRTRSLSAPVDVSVVHKMIAELTNHPTTPKSCPVFATHYSQPYMFWTPWQSKDTLDRWSRTLPCQDTLFCDEMFPLDESRDVARAIYAHQHPVSCDAATFLVITREWVSGIGSAIGVKASMLLLALQTGRVLIDAPDIRWPFTNPELCKKTSMECYFAPLTHCTLPENWRNMGAQQLVQTDVTARFAWSTSSLSAARLGNFSRGLQGFGYDTKPISWWFTHASAFLVRPNPQTIRAACFAWSCIFPRRNDPVRPLASIFIRSGDKYKEATPRKPHEFFNALWQLSHKLAEPIRSVYVSSDSGMLLNGLIQDYRDDWNLYWMGHFRSHNGSFAQYEKSASFTPDLHLRSLITLVDIYIMSAADVVAGSLTSNQCRIVDALRKVQGKARMPYLTPEARLQWTHSGWISGWQGSNATYA